MSTIATPGHSGTAGAGQRKVSDDIADADPPRSGAVTLSMAADDEARHVDGVREPTAT